MNACCLHNCNNAHRQVACKKRNNRKTPKIHTHMPTGYFGCTSAFLNVADRAAVLLLDNLCLLGLLRTVALLLTCVRPSSRVTHPPPLTLSLVALWALSVQAPLHWLVALLQACTTLRRSGCRIMYTQDSISTRKLTWDCLSNCKLLLSECCSICLSLLAPFTLISIPP